MFGGRTERALPGSAFAFALGNSSARRGGENVS